MLSWLLLHVARRGAGYNCLNDTFKGGPLQRGGPPSLRTSPAHGVTLPAVANGFLRDRWEVVKGIYSTKCVRLRCSSQGRSPARQTTVINMILRNFDELAHRRAHKPQNESESLWKCPLSRSTQTLTVARFPQPYKKWLKTYSLLQKCLSKRGWHYA